MFCFIFNNVSSVYVSSFISGYFTCFSIKQNQVDKKVNDISLEGTFQDERFDKISLYDNLLYYYYVVDGEKMSTKTSLKKINKIVNKRRAIITLEEAYNFLEFGERPKCTDFITEQVINEIEYYLSHTKVNPTIYIGYNRIAFFGKEDKDFRLTIDSKIITRREDLFLESGCHGTDILKPNEYLMEVKILDAIPMWLAEIFSELKIYNTHFSKYGNEYMTYCQEQNNHNKNRREKIY